MDNLNQNLPTHIGIIIDGNRRWAKARNLPSFAGHKKGMERIEEIIKYACEIGIQVITLYAFSTENWKRTQKEVTYLLQIFESFAINKIQEINALNIKVRAIGSTDKFPPSLQAAIRNAEETTENNTRMIVNVALNYGGRDEIVRAFKKIASSNMPASEITEELISQNLDTAGLPDPDFIIRTSGEQRLSNFLTWQSIYSELYFPKVLWPDFTVDCFKEALVEFQNRQRRMGK